MADQTAISWCDSTFNPWIGCTKVSPGCDHCYAERDMDKRLGRAQWGAGKARSRTSPENWKWPLRWNRGQFVQCASCNWRGELRAFKREGWVACPACDSNNWVSARRRVFCASLADVFDREAPIEWLADLLDVVRRCIDLDWQLLTKRVGFVGVRLRQVLVHVTEQCPAQYPLPLAQWLCDWLDGKPPANVWLGATVVNQVEADRDVPRLLATPARARFLSLEPLLGPVSIPWAFADIRTACCHQCGFRTNRVGGTCPNDGATLRGDVGIDWIIVGGESGPNARPMHPEWARQLRDQCEAAGVPFHFKQWGEWLPGHHFTPELRELDSDPEKSRYKCAQWEDDELGWDIGWTFTADEYDEDALYRVGKHAAGRLLDGRTHDGMPHQVVANG